VNNETFDLSDFRFISDDHIRYENGNDVSGHNYGSHREIRVQRNNSGTNEYLVTIYNHDGHHPVWGDNVQMAPKRMEIINTSLTHIELRGVGQDQLGNSFDDYGLILHILNNEVTKVTLKMYDRRVSIVYTKPKTTLGTDDNLTLEKTVRTLVKQHFEHYLSTNQAITVDDLEADIANLILYLYLFRQNVTLFNLSFLDYHLLQFIRSEEHKVVVGNILQSVTALYPDHFNDGKRNVLSPNCNSFSTI
jgi:hypothetical protein